MEQTTWKLWIRLRRWLGGEWMYVHVQRADHRIAPRIVHWLEVGVENRVFHLRQAIERTYTPVGCHPNPRDRSCTCPRRHMAWLWQDPKDTSPTCPVPAHAASHSEGASHG
jgi:hypothetical protein